MLVDYLWLIDVYFEVQVNNILRMHVADTVADLTHEQNTVALRQSEVIGHNSFE